MIEESPRQKLFRLTGVYLKEQYAAHILHCIEAGYEKDTSGQDLEGFICQWYASNGFTRVKKVIRRLFPETDDQVLRESPAIWRKYQELLALMRDQGCSLESAIMQLCRKEITEPQVRAVLDAPEEEKTDTPLEHVSPLKLYLSQVWETIKGILYRLTHWK